MKKSIKQMIALAGIFMIIGSNISAGTYKVYNETGKDLKNVKVRGFGPVDIAKPEPGSVSVGLIKFSGGYISGSDVLVNGQPLTFMNFGEYTFGIAANDRTIRIRVMDDGKHLGFVVDHNK